MIKSFNLNIEGRDFVVGDIHGEFTKLQKKLDELVFDTKHDRLFSVGDLVDRGPESEESLNWLAKPWFHAVMGNHEDMLIAAYGKLLDMGMYLYNGGGWFIELEQKHKDVYAQEFQKLPLIIEVETPRGLVGIVHAECMARSWSEFKESIPYYMNTMLWGRNIIHEDATTLEPVEGVLAIYVGHTPVKNPGLIKGNHHFIDSGAVFGAGDLYLEQIN